ncbi:unnamed protein product [Coregonus sp. 'balchen']|nr:unnamed protein product [Coregonus sp. 'balchen']
MPSCDIDDWGSGFDVSMTTVGANNNTSSSQQAGDDSTRIKEESLVFEGLPQAAADIAVRLDTLSQTLQASVTKQL